MYYLVTTINEESPVTLILQQATPVFKSVLANQGAAKMIGDRVRKSQ